MKNTWRVSRRIKIKVVKDLTQYNYEDYTKIAGRIDSSGKGFAQIKDEL